MSIINLKAFLNVAHIVLEAIYGIKYRDLKLHGDKRHKLNRVNICFFADSQSSPANRMQMSWRVRLLHRENLLANFA